VTPSPSGVARAGGCWPNASQTLLLRAALSEPSAAREAFAHWRAQVDLDALDAGSTRLLPLLAHNLRELDDALIRRARGVLRHAWSRNQRLFHRTAPALRALRTEGIPVMLLKGAALVARAYRHAGLRTMNDLDVLVPVAAAAQARACLARLGWRPTYFVREGQLPYLHAIGLGDGSGAEIDLHWHAVFECRRPSDDDACWESAQPVNHVGISVLVPSATDLVLQIATHGLRWSDSPPIHWVADLVWLLRSVGSEVDWERLIHRAHSAGLTLQLRLTLAYVVDEFAAPVPVHAMAALAGARARAGERLELRARSAPPALLRGLLLHWLDYRRLVPGGAGRRLLGFPSYLATIWEVPSLARLPVTAWQKVRSRVRRRPGRG
jgi:hypothetical protein